MLTLQALSDRTEINELVAKYSQAVDAHEWELFDEIFDAESDCDFTVVAGFRGTGAELRQWLSDGLPEGRHYFHLMGASHIVLEGGQATAVTPCLNPMPTPDGGLGVFGLWYHDSFIRRPEGWRIVARRLEFSFFTPIAERDEEPFRFPWPP